jgi:hypothetical protein
VWGTVEMLSAPEQVKVSADVGRLDRHFACAFAAVWAR